MNILKENEIVVREQVRLKFGNIFNFVSTQNKDLGEAREENITGVRKLFKLTKLKHHLPFDFTIYDSNNQPIVKIQKKQASFFVSRVDVFDNSDKLLGTYQQKFKFFKPMFNVLDDQGGQIATVKGNIVAWNYDITDMAGGNIATISKKFAGIAKEIFTTADNYVFRIEKSLPENQRKLFAGAPVIVDMIFKEVKH